MANQSSFSHSTSLRYRKIALDIARDLKGDELEQVKYLCADFLPLGQREAITTTIQLFGELEKQQRMGIDNLLFLKDLLQTLDRFDLLEKVKHFELERDLGLVVLNSQQERHGHTPPDSNNNASSGSTVPNGSQYQRSPGEVTIKCVLELATKGAWVAGSAYIIRRYIDQPEELIRLVSSVVLPTGLLVKYICWGSVKIVTQATDLQSLRELWQRYNDGRLKNKFEEVFVTQELKRLSQGEEISISLHMQSQEYRTACLDLMQAHVKANELIKSLDAPPRRFSCPGFPVRNEETDNTLLRASQLAAWYERQRSTLLSQEMQRIQLERKTSEHPDVKQGVKIDFNVKNDEQTMIKKEDGENGLVAHILDQKEGDELCKLLDPQLILGNDWRMLASGLGLKMAEIRYLELTPFPTRSLLEWAVTRSPTLNVRELREILRKIERNDAVKLLSTNGDRSGPFKRTTLLSDVPYAGRWKLAHYMDIQKDLFYEFAHKCDNSLSYHEIKHLSKAKSPTMALLDQLDAKFPNFTAAELRGILNEIEAYSLEEIFETFMKSECNKNAETVRRRLPFQRSRSIRRSIDEEFLRVEGTKSTDSGLSDGTYFSNSASVDIDYGIDKS